MSAQRHLFMQKWLLPIHAKYFIATFKEAAQYIVKGQYPTHSTIRFITGKEIIFDLSYRISLEQYH